jgi:hypothetical protein
MSAILRSQKQSLHHRSQYLKMKPKNTQYPMKSYQKTLSSQQIMQIHNTIAIPDLEILQDSSLGFCLV